MLGPAPQLIRLRQAAFASIGAGVIHGAAVAMYADNAILARVFLLFTVAQVAWGVAAMTLSNTAIIYLGVAINSSAVAGWALTRTIGISFVQGLKFAEKPQLTDTLCALLGAIAVVALLSVLIRKNIPAARSKTTNSAYVVVGITLVAMVSVSGHAHGQVTIDDATVDSGLVVDANGVIISPTTTTTTSTTSTSNTANTATSATNGIASQDTVIATTTSAMQVTPTLPPKITTTTTTIKPHIQTSDQLLAAASGWPREWDPAKGEDFSGIAGASAEQKSRAVALIANNTRDLAKYSNVSAAIADGYVSIGDSSTGFEHFIKYSLLTDGRVLDTTAPESLVYQVTASARTLVSTMYIANPATAINDATLVNYAGGLMQWHVHNNLCWTLVKGVPQIVAVTDAAGNCPPRSILQTGGAPMVHVWIEKNPCGPFAALEGNGAGVADLPDNQRVDKCNAQH